MAGLLARAVRLASFRRILLEGGGGGQKTEPYELAISLGEGLADLGDVGSAAGPAVPQALAIIGAGHADVEVGVRTHLSRFMLVDPLALASEADRLEGLGVASPFGLLTADRRTARPDAQADPAARCPDRRTRPAGRPPPVPDVAAALRAFADRVTLVDGGYLYRLLRTGPVVFEGAQGVLLDQWRCFHPYTTWSTTTFANAETLLTEAGQTALRLGVTRTYLTRHGPRPVRDRGPTLEIPEPHNSCNRWQGSFRTGHLDAVALRTPSRWTPRP